MENWKEIPEFEGRYEVSNFGRVKSSLKGGRILALVKKSTGYLTVTLCDSDGKRHQRSIHRLVLITFSGADSKEMVLHNDGNKENNALKNLRWGNAKENYADTVIHGSAQIGEAHPCSKITEKIVMEIRSSSGKLHKRAMMKKYNLSKQHVAAILGGRIWKHLLVPSQC